MGNQFERGKQWHTILRMAHGAEPLEELVTPPPRNLESDPDRSYFDPSQMSDKEKQHVTKLQQITGLEFTDSFYLGIAIIRAIGSNTQPPYDGWFENITGEKRNQLIAYIEEYRSASQN
ncbi:MAG: hypothetical protein RL557_876 [archaeon]|jgi:hypothetical protein